MGFIYNLFSYLMKGCLYISGNNYILALFFFALAFQVILLPLAIKQHKSQIKMAQVKPMEMAIREKYKGRTDKATQQKMTMEIQEMYQQNGYNQFSGCLPMLIQLPIIMILFTIVREPITYSSNLQNFDMEANSKEAVVYYQELKDSLNKDAFESETEYNEYIGILYGYQGELGIAKVDDKTPSDAFKFSYNDTEYYASGKGPYTDTAITRLILEGKKELDELAEEGKIQGDKKDSLNAKLVPFGEYADQLPDYSIGSLNFINEPDFNRNFWLMIVPLLVFLTSFLSTKFTRRFSGAATQTDANGNPVGGGLFMEVGMPLISAIFAYSMSAAIGVYWIWRTLLSMVQTYVFAKAMPIPQVTEEQIAEAKKALKSNVKKKKVITIEVDEDDNSYDDMIVNGDGTKKTKTIDPTQRTPRRIEMLTADDDESNSDDSAEN
ncbi:MAG: membrane protein insertase YidC [Clostridia bacterium]|nr:membrane protein insertase YidC [Clostridia bacterium]